MASAVAGYVLDHYRHKSFNILPTAHKGHHQFCRHLKIVKDWKKSCHKDKSSDRRESDDAEELGSLKMGRWKVLSNERNLTMTHLSVDLRRQTQKCERGEEASWVFQMRQYFNNNSNMMAIWTPAMVMMMITNKGECNREEMHWTATKQGHLWTAFGHCHYDWGWWWLL